MWVVFWISIGGILILGGLMITYAGMWRRQKNRANSYILAELERSRITEWLHDQLTLLEDNQARRYNFSQGQAKLYHAWDLGMLTTKAAQEYFQSWIQNIWHKFPDLEIVFLPASPTAQVELEKCLAINRLDGWVWKILDEEGIQIGERASMTHEEAFQLPSSFRYLPEDLKFPESYALVVLSPSGKTHRHIVFDTVTIEANNGSPEVA